MPDWICETRERKIARQRGEPSMRNGGRRLGIGVPYTAASSWRSIGSSRRSPSSHFDSQDVGLPSALQTSVCVNPSWRRTALRVWRSARYAGRCVALRRRFVFGRLAVPTGRRRCPMPTHCTERQNYPSWGIRFTSGHNTLATGDLDPDRASFWDQICMTDAAPLRAPGAVAWHVGDVLSLVMRHDVSPRGPAATDALRQHLLGTVNLPAGTAEPAHELITRWIVSHFPAMDWFTDADRPPRELLSQWLVRRAAEFGEYLVIPPIPLDVVAEHMDGLTRQSEGSASEPGPALS